MRIGIALKQVVFSTMIVLTMNLAQAAEQRSRALVYGEHRGDTIVYHYTVVNNGPERFYNFTIGGEYDAAEDARFPELGKLPLGWKFGREGETGTEIILDPASTTQPTGWKPHVYGKQESGFYYLEWDAFGSGVEGGIKPGQTLSGFSVTVPTGYTEGMRALSTPAESQFKYVDGHFTVGIQKNYKRPEFHGSIEKQDTTPPFISVSVAPTNLWPPNGKLNPVKVTVSVKDDYDPQPEIKLESITANEVLGQDDIGDAEIGSDDRQFSLMAKRDGSSKSGRIYTITYSATDATGNKATASATVTVPHDERK